MWKKQVKRIGSAVLAGFLALAMPLSAAAEDILLISPAPTTTAAQVSLQEALNFSQNGAVQEQTQDVSVLLAAMKQQWTGSEPTDAEYAYLRSEEIVLKYDATVTGELVSTTVDGNTLTVTARADSYTAANGETVTWIPTQVKIGETVKTLTASADGESYEAMFSGLDATALYTAELTYRAALTIDEATASELINRAYEDASAAIEREAQYERDLAAHEAGLKRYQSDLAAYETADALYQAYLKELAVYEAELAAYNEYVEKVKTYEAGVAAYQTYQTALQQYETAYAAYQSALSGMQAQQEAYNAYMQYVAKVNLATGKLAVMESIFTPDSAGRTMYATLMGDTVATVVAQKAELVAAGADGTDVDNAGAATEALKSLLGMYQNCYDDESRYRWYCSYYTQVRDNFIQLFGCLNSLYKNGLVRTALNMKGKLERYQQFVCQLYVISTCLDDSTSFNPSWQMTHKTDNTGGYTVYQRLDSVQIVTDTNAYSPVGTEWPAYVPEVAAPTLPSAPQKPAEVQMPVKTWTQELSAPESKPAAVVQPVKPVLGDYTAGEPTKPVETAELQAVMAVIGEGKLTERVWSGALNFEIETALSRSFTLSGQPTVTFYNDDKKTICYAVHVTEGSPVLYEGETPVREANAQYHYVFTGWVDANGAPADFSEITKDTDFYATYEAVVNRYTVTWELLDGETVKQEYDYGEIPSYRDWEQTFVKGEYEYTFIGWASAVRVVTGDATYKALFRVRSLNEATYAVTFTVGDRQFYRTYKYGETPALEGFEKEYIEGSKLYRFVGWDNEPAPLTSDMVYTAVFEESWLLPAGESFDESAALTQTTKTLTVITDRRVVDASWAVARAIEKGQELVISLGDAKLTLDTAALKAMSNAAIFRIEPVASADGMSYELTVTDENGKAITADAEMLLELPLAEDLAAHKHLGVYVEGEAVTGSQSGSAMYLRTKKSGTVSIRPFYRITIETVEGGAVTSEVTEAHIGDTVALTLFTEQGWRLVSLDAVQTGTDEPAGLIGQTLTMTAADVTVKAVFEQIEYTVSFMNGSREISSAVYHYGDTVKLPADPTWEGEVAGGESYTFSGWSPMVVPVTESVVYTAQFTRATLGDNGAYGTGRNSNKLVTVFLPIVAVVAVVGVGGAVGWKVWGKKKKG